MKKIKSNMSWQTNSRCAFIKIALFCFISVTLPVYSNQMIEDDLIEIVGFLDDFVPNEDDVMVTVGSVSDSYCDFTSIQKAIEADADEIRVVTQVYDENLKVINKSVRINGGYQDCKNAINGVSDGTRAVINGDSYYSATVTLISEKTHSDVQLSHLIVGGAKQGLYTFSSDLNLLIEDVDFTNNTESGVLLRSGNTKVYMKDSAITWNGGHGLWCQGPDETTSPSDYGGKPNDKDMVVVMEGMTIEHNSALSWTHNSGGAGKLESGCRLSLFSPASISYNQSYAGGGAFVVQEGQSTVGSSLNLYGSEYCAGRRCFGEVGQNIQVKNNSTVGYGAGGAIHLRSDSQFFAKNVNFKNNAANLGGGINSSNSIVKIVNSSFVGNRADVGVALQVKGGHVDIEGSYFTDNGANNFAYEDMHLFNFFSGSHNLKFNTIADNHTIGNIINNEFTGSVVVSGSIITGSGPINNHWLDSTSYYCSIVHELESFPPGTSSVFIEEPMFVDPESGDYHIKSSSPAVDMCNAIVLPQDLYHDQDGDVRGQNLPWITNLYGAFDAGADEVPAKDVSDK